MRGCEGAGWGWNGEEMIYEEGGSSKPHRLHCIGGCSRKRCRVEWNISWLDNNLIGSNETTRGVDNLKNEKMDFS